MLSTKDYKEEYKEICSAKGIEPTTDGFNLYKKAVTSLYHAVCLDIDDTITYNNRNEKKMLVRALAHLTKINVIICFITGRGKNNIMAPMSRPAAKFQR